MRYFGLANGVFGDRMRGKVTSRVTLLLAKIHFIENPTCRLLWFNNGPGVTFRLQLISLWNNKKKEFVDLGNPLTTLEHQLLASI